MVYAIASETIRYFERALGRDAKWGFRSRRGPLANRLRILPHAIQDANAYYSRELGGLVFGYFRASEDDPGDNLPGQTIFTCLSHDIVAHETTHALVDGLRMYFMEDTGRDVAAFHEAFADIVALFEHFAVSEALVDTIQRTGGQLHIIALQPEAPVVDGHPLILSQLGGTNPLVELAKQFGEAIGQRKALRSALGAPPEPGALDKLFEPHARGSILVAAVFDAFFSVYLKRTRDLLRIGRANGSALGPGEVHPDLANRLAGEAAKLAVHFVNMCVRALDYCPPVDITFGEFLRALVTADSDLVPADDWGYRDALIQAFRLRGIRPEGVVSFAEDSLRWSGPPGNRELRCEGLEFDVIHGTKAEQLARNARLLSRFGTSHARALGLQSSVPVQAHSFHPVHRVGPDGRLKFEIVAELLQRRRGVPVDPKNRDSATFTFRGGATLVLEDDGTIRYAVHKWLDDKKRLERQRAHYDHLDVVSPLTVFEVPLGGGPRLRDITRRVDFCAVHRGM